MRLPLALVVLGTETVVGYNADGNVYSLFWDQGNQRWKYHCSRKFAFAPTLAGRTVHLLNGSTLTSLADQGGSAALTPSPAALPNTPLTPINVWFNTLLVGVGDGGDARLLALRRENPIDQRSFDPPSGNIYLPAVGQETIYIGADRLYAIDANLFDRAIQKLSGATPRLWRHYRGAGLRLSWGDGACRTVCGERQPGDRPGRQHRCNHLDL
jgi:hypothetical protein